MPPSEQGLRNTLREQPSYDLHRHDPAHDPALGSDVNFLNRLLDKIARALSVQSFELVEYVEYEE